MGHEKAGKKLKILTETVAQKQKNKYRRNNTQTQLPAEKGGQFYGKTAFACGEGKAVFFRLFFVCFFGLFGLA